jgi:hypothetical protein
MVQVDYAQMENTSFYLRYKYRQKEKNRTPPSGGELSILPYEQHRARLQVQYGIRAVRLKTSVDGILYAETGRQSKGVMAAQSIGWQPATIPFRADLYVAWFRTDDYDTRLSSYEKNMLYAFHLLQLYGKGIRLSATLRWDALPELSLFAKLACTQYADRDVIGTGTEAVEGNIKSDISLLLRRKF